MSWPGTEEATIVVLQQLMCSGWRQAALTRQLTPLNSICHVLYSETMKNVVVITIVVVVVVVVKPRKSQPPHECLRLEGDLLCNEWYNQQQSHGLTAHTGLPSLPHFLSTVCNGNIVCINTMECAYVCICSFII
jgi:hypothetical protein